MYWLGDSPRLFIFNICWCWYWDWYSAKPTSFLSRGNRSVTTSIRRHNNNPLTSCRGKYEESYSDIKMMMCFDSNCRGRCLWWPVLISWIFWMCNVIQTRKSHFYKSEGLYLTMKCILVCCCFLHLSVLASHLLGKPIKCFYFIFISYHQVETEDETLTPRSSRCKEEGLVTGSCRAALARWSWVERSCERFLYGGCGGTDNNFHSLEDCQETCSGHGGEKRD